MLNFITHPRQTPRGLPQQDNRQPKSHNHHTTRQVAPDNRFARRPSGLPFPEREMTQIESSLIRALIANRQR